MPVVFLSGDSNICAEVNATNPAATTIETKYGRGASVVTITPAAACALIQQGVQAALTSDLSNHARPKADHYRMDLRFSHHELAFARSFYPGARLIADDTIRIEAEDIYEIARALVFM